MTTAEILNAAWALIDTPDKWAREWYAYTAEGEWCRGEDETACKRCAIGALQGAGDPEYTDALLTLAAAVGGTTGVDVHEFNDDPNTTHDDVKAAFAKAIEAVA